MVQSERTLFESCLEVDEKERSAFLRRACPENEEMRERVLNLLEAHERASRETHDPDSLEFWKADGARQQHGRTETGRETDSAGPGGLYCAECQATIDDASRETCSRCRCARPRSGWPEDPLLGKEIAAGQYRVTRRLGEGGFGVVYEVETVVGGLRRALKVLRERWTEDDDVRQRFINEALVLEQVNHPNVARCYSAGTLERGELYLLFELIEGTPVSELIREASDGAPMKPLKAVRIAKQVASGLAAAHARQVLHRDLKPANILVVQSDRNEERAKLLDFGIAKLLELDYTASGQLVGTPAFMAPEQLNPQQKVGVGTDLWQLGATLFAMLTGSPPYSRKGDSLQEIQVRVRTPGEPGPAPSEVRPELASHPALDQLVSRLLATDPADRYESATEVCEALARVEQLLSPAAASTRQTLLDALCAHPSPNSWGALCRYLGNQESEVRKLAEEKLASWPTAMRRATLGWWDQVRRGESHPLWALARSLDLSGHGLTDSEVVRLSNCPALESIRELDLSRNAIGPEGMAALAGSRYLERLEHLELGGNRLGLRGMESLARSPFLRKLRFLGLSGNRIDTEGLGSLLKSDLYLECFDLSDNELRTEGAEILSQASLKKLKTLNLRGNHIGPHGVAVLVVSSLVSTLRRLDLSRNALGPGGAASLAISKHLSRLRSLGLSQNNLGRQGLQLLLASSGLDTVEELDISSNALGPNGAMALASSSMARRLKRLDISDNDIEDAGLASLLGTPQLAGLSHLVAAQNSLTPSGVGLFEGVAMQLEGLDLSHNTLGERGGELLGAAIARIRLRSLEIRGAGLSGTELVGIIQGGSGGLALLDVSENPLGDEGMDLLSRSAEVRSLHQLMVSRTGSNSAGMVSLMSSPHLMNLQILGFDSNGLGDAGVVEMTSRSGLVSLEELSLQDNGIGAEGAVALATSSLAGRLKKLNLSYNRLGDAGAEGLAHGPNWQQLRELLLAANDVGLGGASSLLASSSMEMMQRLDLSDNPLLGELDVHALAHDKVALMESSFARISTEGKAFAERFYRELFERYPGVKPLFAHVSMSRQQQHLFSSLVMIIENLRKPEEVEESLTRLGERHVGYGVNPSHYYAVSGTLLEVIRIFLKEEWNDAVHEAWADGLEAVSRVMMKAHRRQR